MQVEDRYFSQDKNYLLKTVQAFSKEHLLDLWTKEIWIAYNLQHNPMGLEDSFTLELKEKIGAVKDLLTESYDVLAAIYRFDFGDNQLSFQWDGRTHMEVYDADWKEMYTHWIQELSMIKEIQRPLLKYVVSAGQTSTDFLVQSIRKGILSYFGIRMRAQTIYRISA